jgi:hypothetical protein
MHPFEEVLSVAREDIEFALQAVGSEPWAEFLLNPRRLRGSDFLMRWSQGVWSENRIVDAVHKTKEYFALAYGPSGTAPEHDVRAFELYFERLEAAGLGKLKRPDLLLFRTADRLEVERVVNDLGGNAELPFIEETNAGMRRLLETSIVAIECENSLWVAKKMPAYGVALTPQKRLGGKPGLKKTAVAPTVIVKEEDRGPLKAWQEQNKVPIHIWHAFYDLAFGLSLDSAEKLVEDGLILPTTQVFQAPGGVTTSKNIYKFYYHHAYHLADAVSDPQLVAAHIVDKNGHILPFVRFEGGGIQLAQSALAQLSLCEKAKFG